MYCDVFRLFDYFIFWNAEPFDFSTLSIIIQIYSER